MSARPTPFIFLFPTGPKIFEICYIVRRQQCIAVIWAIRREAVIVAFSFCAANRFRRVPAWRSILPLDRDNRAATLSPFA
jgi:hypothetical protein